MRLGLCFLLLSSAAAQQKLTVTSTKPTIAGPKLPLIDYNACPGKDANVPQWKLVQKDQIYSSWRPNRTAVGALKAGDEVTVIMGISVIREPDRAIATHPGSELPLKAGEVALRYGLDPDGNWQFWGKGVWFSEIYEQVVEKGDSCGFGDESQCTMQITKNGVREWWVQVKTQDVRKGWLLASKPGQLPWFSINFGSLCRLD
jgi:hypothetical protein